MFHRTFLLIVLIAFVSACSDSHDAPDRSNAPDNSGTDTDSGSDNNNPGSEQYSAQIARTAGGVPHIKAQDWGSLGYGYGYAMSQDNYCTILEAVVQVNGESQRYLGDEGSLAADAVRALLALDAQEVAYDPQPKYIKDYMTGWAAGINRYLKDTGADKLAEGENGCRDAPWVRPLTQADIAVMLQGQMSPIHVNLAGLLFAQKGPPAEMAKTRMTPAIKHLSPGETAELSVQLASLDLLPPEKLGSNGYTLGAGATQSGRGMVLSNPHWVWKGVGRFYMSHLTMGDEYDVSGAHPLISPFIGFGFNKDVAFTHTVSTGKRFVFFELTLNPDNPMQYEFDGEMRDFTTKTVTVNVDTGAGIEPQEHTFYFSHHGPVLDLGALLPPLGGWPNSFGTVFAVKDVVVDNARGPDQWIRMGQATSTAEYIETLKTIGMNIYNSFAADRHGSTFYGDISTIAHVSDAKAAHCIQGAIPELMKSRGIWLLSGNTSDCELGEDGDAPVAGIFGFNSLPGLTNASYASNSNDSYWLSNPDHLLEGHPEAVGAEGVEQSMRTRAGFVLAEERIAGTDGLGDPGFTIETLQEVFFGSRNHAAELSLDALLTLCANEPDWSTYSSSPGEVIQACDILQQWNRTHNLDTVGGHIFTEFWRKARNIADLWATPFSATDPVHTPRDINATDPAVTEALKQALADGVQLLLDNGIALDATWEQVQFIERNGERIGLPGGWSGMMWSVIISDLIAGEGYSDIEHGNTYIHTVTFDDSDCPVAFGVTAPSTSTDPVSPHYADQTRLYSQKQWLDLALCEADVDAARVGDVTQLEGDVAL